MNLDPRSTELVSERIAAMTIEIHQPELEALIRQRMESGQFQSVEDVLLLALKSWPDASREARALPGKPAAPSGRTGAEIVAAMQRSPHKDVDLEPSRPRMSVRDVQL
jgi:hypothetical protein